MRLRLTLILALLVSVSLVAPAVLGANGPDPASDPKVAQLEVTFLKGMVPHHRDAIMMAEMAAQKSPRPELRALAQKIIDDQNAEIVKMSAFLRDWYSEEPPKEATVPMDIMSQFEMPILQGLTPDMAASMMALEEKSGADFDIAFMSAMIDHHATAVQMAAPVLIAGYHQDLRSLAVQIVIAQGEEIRQLDRWLDLWYGVKRPL